jgi:hypothetical protein
MATFELYRRSTIGTCLTETLDDLVSSGVGTPELAIQVLVQFDKVVPLLFLSPHPARFTIHTRSLLNLIFLLVLVHD